MLLAVSLLSFLTSKQASADVRFQVVDLDLLQAHSVSVTNSGEVVVVGTYQVPPNFQRATRQRLGGMVEDLGTLPGGNYSEAYDLLNDETGEIIVGSSHSYGPDGIHRVRAYVHRNGAMQNLDPVSDYSEALAVNENRIAVGRADFDQIVPRPVMWNLDNETMSPLGSFIEGSATGISASNRVCGNIVDSEGNMRAAVLNDLTGDWEFLNVPGQESRATGISNAGISGYSFGLDGSRQAFIVMNDGTVVFPDRLGGSSNTLSSITSWGAAGLFISEEFGTRAYLWDAVNGAQDVNDLIDPNSGWELQAITGMNEEGYMVGLGTNPQGAFGTFALVPIPGPSSGIALTLFSAIAGRRRR